VPSRIAAILFDTKSNRRRQREEQQQINTRGNPIELRAVKVIPSKKTESEDVRLPPEVSFSQRFEADFDEVFAYQMRHMLRELRTPITRTNPGSDIMKIKFNEAITASLEEHELIMRGIASASDPNGMTAAELVQEAEGLGLDPKEVMQEVLLGAFNPSVDNPQET